MTLTRVARANENVGAGFMGTMRIQFYGSVGNGFSFDLPFENLRAMSNIEWLKTLRFSKGIPFRGSARRPIPTGPLARPGDFMRGGDKISLS